jgi:hypothetical protein
LNIILLTNTIVTLEHMLTNDQLTAASLFDARGPSCCSSASSSGCSAAPPFDQLDSVVAATIAAWPRVCVDGVDGVFDGADRVASDVYVSN